MPRSLGSLAGLFLALSVGACGDDAATDGGSPGADAALDAGPPCAADLDCADGVFCNGVERCMPGDPAADGRGCVAALASACQEGQECDEAVGRCRTLCGVTVDADGDGRTAVECGGDDCDDADRERFPGNTEVCDAEGHDEDCSPGTFGERDVDGDGFVDATCCNRDGGDALSCGDDCEDTDGTIHPDAVDLCDGADNDCDSAVDEAELALHYLDVDGDGFGDPAAPTVRDCTPSEFFVTNASDCDDANASIGPGASERCDGIDDDCDGRFDEGASSACALSRNESQVCVEGACQVLHCPPGAGDCDLEANNGCETDLATSSRHCGACGQLCPFGAACAGGVCADTAVTAIVAGARHACILTARGEASCWGDNQRGQLGRDAPGEPRPEPWVVESLPPATRLASDSEMDLTCAVTEAHDLYCWGESAALSAGPTASPIKSDVEDVALAEDHLCVIDTAGDVLCLGANDRGQLGDGTTDPRTGWVPSLFAGPMRSLGVAVGFTCALMDDGTGSAFCAGDGERAVHGGAAVEPAPIPVSGLEGLVQIAAGPVGGVGVMPDGSVTTWGDDLLLLHAGPEPAPAAGITGALAVDKSAHHACAALGASGVRCWGAAIEAVVATGEAPTSVTLSDGSQVGLTAPLGIPGVATDVAVGREFSCAVHSGQTYSCWGNNAHSQLGAGTALEVGGGRLSAAVGYGETTLGIGHRCGRRRDGSVRCWGWDTFGQRGDGAITGGPEVGATWVEGEGSLAQLACGSDHCCGVEAGGTAVCWGKGDRGALGTGETAHHQGPVAVSGLSDLVKVVAGWDCSCGLSADGSVSCWGFGGNGRLGTGSTDTELVPTLVVGVTDAVALAASWRHACVVHRSGAVSCWGEGESGQLGNGVTGEPFALAPVPVSGIDSARSVAVGVEHTCSILADRTVRCWGTNDRGQLGDETRALRTEPVTARGLSFATQLALGTDHTCARIGTSRIRCWGANDRGQLGDGTTVDRLSPALASDVMGIDEPVVFLAAFFHTTCASLLSGAVKCWGANDDGTLGAPGAGAFSTRAVRVTSLE